MRRTIRAAALLLLVALLLTGCAGKPSEENTAAVSPAAQEALKRDIQGPLAERVQALLASYENELSQPALKETGNLTYTIPGDILTQMGLDAWETGAQAVNGRWRFTWRQTGEYAYEATADDVPAQSPDPDSETPMDSQLNGDYAVSGGGLFQRERAYDAAEDLSSGQAEITDSLNGSVTGHEIFRFCVRDGQLFFADATMDVSFDMDGAAVQSGFLAAVGVLRADGLDIVEYLMDSLDELPDPAVLNWSSLLASVTPVSSLSAQKDHVESK